MSTVDVRGIDLQEVLAAPGAWTTVYTDGPQGEPPGAVESRMRSLKDRLSEAGVPDDDADAVLAVLPQDIGLPAPSARWLLVRDGAVVVDEGFSTPRRGLERVAHGPFPEIVPLLRHHGSERSILVVETGRDGADLALHRIGRPDPEQVEEVQGEGWPLTKVSPGGWSQARFQRGVEELWQRNQDEVAETVDRIVRERRPEHVFVSGDPHVRGLLLESIAPESLDLVVEVDADTRADGADDAALTEAVDQTIGAAHQEVISGIRDRAAEQDGRNGALGVAAVVAALQQAQVETLLLDERVADADATLLALPEAPWIAVTPRDAFDAGPGTPIATAEALVRAAILTDAEVVFLEDEPGEGEPRASGDPEPPLAVLRWPAASLTGEPGSHLAAAPEDASGAGTDTGGTGGGTGTGTGGTGSTGAGSSSGGTEQPPSRSGESWEPGHPSQAEGEDPDEPAGHPDPRTDGHPSQAEGEDPDRP